MVYYESYFDNTSDVEIEKKIITHIEPRIINDHHDENMIEEHYVNAGDVITGFILLDEFGDLDEANIFFLPNTT